MSVPDMETKAVHSWGRIDLTLRNAGGRRLESFNSFNNAIAWLLSNPLITTVIVIPLRAFACALVLAAFLAPAGATLAQEFNLVIRNHKFEPEEIRVPAGKRVSVYVTNEDATPEEFDSPALKVEKVIPAKSKGLVRIGPLSPGRYEFIGEFHADTAKGVVIAE
jgi:cupredoxin-like protein